jgi:hypothetical protein
MPLCLNYNMNMYQKLAHSGLQPYKQTGVSGEPYSLPSTPSTFYMGGSMGPRAGLDVAGKKRIHAPVKK